MDHQEKKSFSVPVFLGKVVLLYGIIAAAHALVDMPSKELASNTEWLDILVGFLLFYAPSLVFMVGWHTMAAHKAKNVSQKHKNVSSLYSYLIAFFLVIVLEIAFFAYDSANYMTNPISGRVFFYSNLFISGLARVVAYTLLIRTGRPLPPQVLAGSTEDSFHQVKHDTERHTVQADINASIANSAANTQNNDLPNIF